MEEIYPDGDVFFVIGDEKNRLRVSSVILRNSSSVFHAMLGSRYGEGQKLLSQGSVEVTLPEDDLDALITVLHILHGRNDHILEEVPGAKLCDIATLCDKYDLFVPLKFAIQQWLDVCSETTDSTELWLLMSAAY